MPGLPEKLPALIFELTNVGTPSLVKPHSAIVSALTTPLNNNSSKMLKLNNLNVFVFIFLVVIGELLSFIKFSIF